VQRAMRGVQRVGRELLRTNCTCVHAKLAHGRWQRAGTGRSAGYFIRLSRRRGRAVRRSRGAGGVQSGSRYQRSCCRGVHERGGDCRRSNAPYVARGLQTGRRSRT
jgi:hypothetical protein